MSNKNDLNNEPLNDEETPFNDVNGSESESVILSEKDYLAEKELANFLEGGDSAVSQIMQQNADLKLSVLDLKSRNRKVWTAVILLILTICGLVFVWLNYFPKYKYIVTTNNAAVCEAGTLNAPLAKGIGDKTATKFSASGLTVQGKRFNAAAWARAQAKAKHKEGSAPRQASAKSASPASQAADPASQQPAAQPKP